MTEKTHKEKAEEWVRQEVEKRVNDMMDRPAKQFSLNPSGIQVNGLSGRYKGYDMARQAQGMSFPTTAKKEAFVKGMIDLISKTNNETTGSEGGFLVPTGITEEILRFGSQNSIALRDCRIITMTSNSHTVPVESSGITVTGENEESAINASHPAFTEVTLNARRYGAISTVSNELLMDSAVDLVSYFQTIMSQAIGSKIDDLVFNGGDTFSGALSGAGQTQTLAATGGYAGLAASDLSGAMGKLTAAQKIGAKYYFSDPAVAKLMGEVNAAGNYVFPPSDPTATYYGLPLVGCEQLPSPLTTSTNFGLLTALNQSYVLGVRTNNMTIELDRYGKFDTYQTRIRLVFRCHGQVGQSSGIVVFKTSA